MEPIKLPNCNAVYAEDTDFPLPATVDGQGVIEMVWQPDEQERRALAAGGRVRITMLAPPFCEVPTMGVGVVGPWCEEHQRATGWIAGLESWGCSVEDDSAADS